MMFPDDFSAFFLVMDCNHPSEPEASDTLYYILYYIILCYIILIFLYNIYNIILHYFNSYHFILYDMSFM